MSEFAWLEDSPTEQPIFPVEAPDGRVNVDELPRQTRFFKLLRMCAPGVYAFAIPNAGKRNPRLAKLEGVSAGLFDTECRWNHGDAQIEFKGYRYRDKQRGTRVAGALSPTQISHGNRMTRLGHRVACFFDEKNAIRWLAELGAPVDLALLDELKGVHSNVGGTDARRKKAAALSQ